MSCGTQVVVCRAVQSHILLDALVKLMHQRLTVLFKFKSWKGLKSRTNAGFIPKKKDVRVKPNRSRRFRDSPLFLKTKFLTGQNCVQEYNQVKNVRQCQKAEFHPSKSTVLPTHNKQLFYSTKKTIELTTPHSVQVTSKYFYSFKILTRHFFCGYSLSGKRDQKMF